MSLWAVPSSDAEADADDEREDGLRGLKAAVRSGATPSEVATDEEAEEVAVLAVAVVELDEKDCGWWSEPFLFVTKSESRKDLA